MRDCFVINVKPCKLVLHMVFLCGLFCKKLKAMKDCVVRFFLMEACSVRNLNPRKLVLYIYYYGGLLCKKCRSMKACVVCVLGFFVFYRGLFC